jgi:hypothetical protein
MIRSEVGVGKSIFELIIFENMFEFGAKASFNFPITMCTVPRILPRSILQCRSYVVLGRAIAIC